MPFLNDRFYYQRTAKQEDINDRFAEGLVEAYSEATGTSGVTSGTYSNATITVDSRGRVTSAVAGAAPTASEWTELTSGTVSVQAALSIVLTSYISAGYKAFKLQLTNFLPASNGFDLLYRSSTDGGSTYDATAGHYGYWCNSNGAGGTIVPAGSNSATAITVARLVGNATTEGYDGSIQTGDVTNSAIWQRVRFEGAYTDSTATPEVAFATGGGARKTNADVDAIRVLYSSGNITSGSYRLYGRSV